jgi:hypothetical protein
LSKLLKLSAIALFCTLAACGKNEPNSTPSAPTTPVTSTSPSVAPSGKANPVPLPAPILKTTEFQPKNLVDADYVGVTKSEDIIAIAAATTDHQFTDDELAGLFNAKVNFIANAFDKQAAIKATADKGRELLRKWKGTKGLSLDVETVTLGFEHFDFATSTFKATGLVEGLTAARYTQDGEISPTMPTLDLSGTPAAMYVYKPATTDEAKMLEGLVAAYTTGGFQARYHIQIVSSTYENNRTVLKLAVVAVDLKRKSSGQAVVSLRAL